MPSVMSAKPEHLSTKPFQRSSNMQTRQPKQYLSLLLVLLVSQLWSKNKNHWCGNTKIKRKLGDKKYFSQNSWRTADLRQSLPCSNSKIPLGTQRPQLGSRANSWTGPRCCLWKELLWLLSVTLSPALSKTLIFIFLHPIWPERWQACLFRKKVYGEFEVSFMVVEVGLRGLFSNTSRFFWWGVGNQIPGFFGNAVPSEAWVSEVFTFNQIHRQ